MRMGTVARRWWIGIAWAAGCLSMLPAPSFGDALADLRATFDAGDYEAVVAGCAAALESGGRLACDDAALLALEGLAYRRLRRTALSDEAWCDALERCPVWRPDPRFRGDEVAIVDALRDRCHAPDFERANPPPTPLPATLAGRWHAGASFGVTLPSGSLGDSRQYAEPDGESNAIPVDVGPLGGVDRGIQVGLFAERFVAGRWAIGASAVLHLLGQDKKSWFEEEFIQVSHRLVKLGLYGKYLLLDGPWSPYFKGGMGVTMEHYEISAIDFPSQADPYDIRRTRTKPGITIGVGALALVTPGLGLEAEVMTDVLFDRQTIGGPPDGLYELDDQDQTLVLDEVTRSTRFVSLRIALTVPIGRSAG